MSTSRRTPIYALGCLYPPTANEQPVPTTIQQLQQSGFDSPMLSLFHIGRDYNINPPQVTGDIYFNDTLVISKGRYVGDPQWPDLVKTITTAGDVKRLGASIGGGGVLDFQTIKRIYEANNNSFAGTNLETNWHVFKATFPNVSFIDMDCEETYDQDSFVAFCQMLINMGFDITFCPYATSEIPFWTGSLRSLNSSNPGAVKWWNLQCYDGGYGNDPAYWANAITNSIPGFNTNDFIVAGDWTNDTPQQVQTLMSTFRNEPSVGGGFIWTLDDIIKQAPSNPLPRMQAYSKAILVGLGQPHYSPM